MSSISERAKGKRPQQAISDSEEEAGNAQSSPSAQLSRKRSKKRVEDANEDMNAEEMEEVDVTGAVLRDAQFARAQPLVRDKNGFVTGSIIRVKCIEFLTYAKVEFFPGSDLNMIIGPNGTGKSSISCAIAIGLGFPPAALGRQKKVKEFIRNDSEYAEVEIELKGPLGKPNVIVHRTITRAGGSTFKLDKVVATAKQVNTKMEELNIQITNLCTYLPQDRVAKFAEMLGPELLRETQRAAGAEKLTAWHESLIQESLNVKEYTQTFDKAKKHLATLQDKNGRTAKEVEEFKEQEARAQRLAILEGVILYAKDDLRLLEHKEATVALTTLDAELADLDKINKPFTDSKKSLKVLVDEFRLEKDKLSKLSTKAVREVSKAAAHLNESKDAIEKATDNLSSLTAATRSTKRGIAEMKSKIAKLQLSVDNKPAVYDPKPFKEQKSNINRKAMDVDAQQRALDADSISSTSDIHAVHVRLTKIKERLSALDNVTQQKLNDLEKNAPNAFHAKNWVDNNQAHFKGKVYDPIRFCINVKDRSLADLAENPIPRAQGETIIFELQEDYEFMTREYVDRGRKKFNGAQLPEGTNLQFYINEREQKLASKSITQQEIESWGFDAYAIDLVQGPDIVLAYLCQTARLHLMPVNTTNKPINSSALEDTKLFNRYNTLDGSHTVKHSNYGARVSANEMRPLTRAFYLGESDNSEQRKVLLTEGANSKAEEKALRATVEDFKKKKHELAKGRRSLTDELSEITHDDTEAQKPYNHWKKELSKLQLDQARLKVEEAKPDSSQQEATFRAIVTQQTTKRIALGRQFAILLKHTDNVLEEVQANTDLQAMNASSAERNVAINEKEVEIEQAKTLKLALYGESKKARRLVTEWRAENEHLQEEAEKKVAEGLSLAALEEAEALDNARNAGKNRVSNVVIEQYKQRLIEIAAEEKIVAEASATLLASQTKIETVKGKWLPALKDLVGQISARFSKAFDSMGRLGEVAIAQDSDYAKWGIDILCSFREGESVRKLTGNRQSGGERGLATIMYLLALAELGKAPFSLVDEINQGMDQNVERQVHNMLVKTTSGDQVGQYFLITPKLLTHLDYSPSMKVLIINAGNWVPEKLMLSKVLQKKQLRVAQAKAKAA